MKRPYRQPGFTLIELLMATGLAIAALAMASLAMLAQNNAMYALDQTRGANGAGREAILLIEESLRRLGWGIDPRYAIDFKYGNCATQPQPCRDSTSAPDELVFVARSPNYYWLNNGDPGCSLVGGCSYGRAWPITSVTTGGSPSTLTITPQATNTAIVTTRPGQVVLAMCSAGQNAVMLTLSQSYTISGTSAVLLSRREQRWDAGQHARSDPGCQKRRRHAGGVRHSTFVGWLRIRRSQQPQWGPRR